jgi:hypothetical protein
MTKESRFFLSGPCFFCHNKIEVQLALSRDALLFWGPESWELLGSAWRSSIGQTKGYSSSILTLFPPKPKVA